MKKLVFILLMAFSMSAFSQISLADVQVVQQIFGAEKIVLVKEYMKFSQEQDEAFWPIYNDYEAARQDLGKEKIALYEDYLNHVQDITAEKATELVNKSIQIETSFKKLQKKYFKTMSKEIGAVKAAQFMQFENYINNIINLSIQEYIPFVGELHQKYAKEVQKKK